MNEFSSTSEHEEDDQSLKNELSDNDSFLTMAVAVVAASRHHRQRNPQPIHNSRLTGNMRVEEIINGHEEIIQDLINIKSDTFKALSDVLGSRELLRPTRYINVHEQLFIFLIYLCTRRNEQIHILFVPAF